MKKTIPFIGKTIPFIGKTIPFIGKFPGEKQGDDFSWYYMGAPAVRLTPAAAPGKEERR